MTTKEPIEGVDLQRLVVALRLRIAHLIGLLLFMGAFGWGIFQAICKDDQEILAMLRGGYIVWICLFIDRWLERKSSGQNETNGATEPKR
jgi:hypothetical protein